VAEINSHIKAHTNVLEGLERENLNGLFYMEQDYGK